MSTKPAHYIVIAAPFFEGNAEETKKYIAEQAETEGPQALLKKVWVIRGERVGCAIGTAQMELAGTNRGVSIDVTLEPPKRRKPRKDRGTRRAATTMPAPAGAPAPAAAGQAA